MFLIIGDPHFTASNIPAIDLFIGKLQKLIKKVNPRIIIMLGDLLHEHERLHTTPLNKAYDFIKMLSTHAYVYCLVGNHDLINNRQFLTKNHWMNAMKEWEGVEIIDYPRFVQRDGMTFSLVPYVPPGNFVEALDFLSEWKKSDLIFAHQEMRGCKMGAIISEEGDEWDETYPLLVSGHIHSHQWVGTNVYYPGACMQHAFGESEKNIIATISPQKEIREFDLELPRKRIVYMDMKDIKTYTVPDTKDTLKLTISGNQQEFKSFKKTKKYKELMKSGVKIVYKYKKDAETERRIKENGDENFMNILHQLVENNKTEYLETDYKNLLKNNV
jgi:DNA repair exonuclease SbcCD nuclease subunit